jgi:hypothetical protein
MIVDRNTHERQIGTEMIIIISPTTNNQTSLSEEVSFTLCNVWMKSVLIGAHQ